MQWLWRASHSRLEPFKKLAWTLRAHLAGILVWTKLRVSNGALEGMNNKVKVISHCADGYRTTWTYMANIYHHSASGSHSRDTLGEEPRSWAPTPRSTLSLHRSTCLVGLRRSLLETLAKSAFPGSLDDISDLRGLRGFRLPPGIKGPPGAANCPAAPPSLLGSGKALSTPQNSNARQGGATRSMAGAVS